MDKIYPLKGKNFNTLWKISTLTGGKSIAL